MLTNDEIRQRFDSAFLPLRCVAEIWDYEQKLRFVISNSADKAVMKMDSLVLNSLREPVALESLIAEICLRIEK